MITVENLAAPVRRIIWDWNGTLFNDAWLCMDVMNGLLAARGLPLLTLDRYQRVFDFPVIDYYRRLGYDFEREPFEVVGTEFIREYERRRLECELHDGAWQALQRFQTEGLAQTVLSAYEHSTLESLLNHFGIRSFFAQVTGNADHYATGKLDNGLAWMRASGAAPGEVLLIGDTRHDAEVAKAMGVQCVLMEGGNQDRERLAACGVPLYPSLRAFVDALG
jgi:phosphoglycolate phosphatase